MRKPLIFLTLILALTQCSTPKEKIPPAEPMTKAASGKVVVYQLMTRLFGNKKTTNKSFGTIEENGVGKFSDINDAALRGIKEMGVTHVWFTGVLEHAVLTDYTKFNIPLDDADVVKGRAGSPYAIKDYYDVNPDLANDVPKRMEEFDALVARTHAQELKVIIDFVPNHVARAYHSDAKPAGVKDLGENDDKTKAFSPSNNFYYLPGKSFQVPKQYQSLGSNPFPTKDGKFEETPAKVTGNDQFTESPGVNEWFETVKLNYGVDIQDNRKTYFDPVPDTWVKMKDILAFWAAKNVDGFRCDMAEMVPVEFWSWCIPQIKAINPGIIFIAEIYNPTQYKNYVQTGKFDFLYDKVELYDLLRLGFYKPGNHSTVEIDTIHKRHTQEGIADVMLHFLENHDEQRAASAAFAGDAWKAVPAMTTSALINKGAVMIYFGQEVGEPGNGAEGFQTEDGRTTIFDYWGVPEHQKWMNNGAFDGALLSPEQKQLRQFYVDLLNIAGKNPAIVNGAYIDVTGFNQAAGNFGRDVHAFIRHHEEEKLLVITSFNDKPKSVKVQLSPEAIAALGLGAPENFIVRDMLWREVEAGFDKDYAFTLNLKPYSALVLKFK
jgi:glycosidase